MVGMANPIPNPTLYILAVTKPDGTYTNLYSSYDRCACERKLGLLVMRNDYPEKDLDIFPLPEVLRMGFGDGYYCENN